jgi:Methyltransferase domain
MSISPAAPTAAGQRPSRPRRLTGLLWRLAARAAKVVLPRPVQAPIARRLGERNDRRRVIDLSFARFLREAPAEALRDPNRLAELLCVGGLNDEILEQFPAEIHPYTGYGLRLWQYPKQFAPYLVEVGRRGVERYLEIGIRHGGSFVATVEYLSRLAPLREAVAVDIDPVAALLPYPLDQAAVRLMQADTQTPEFADWVRRQGPFDLVFIDGLHTFDACQRDFASVLEHARLIALHDIVSPLVPDVGRVWKDVKRNCADRFEFVEFTDQYAGVKAASGQDHMGIGLAIRREADG